MAMAREEIIKEIFEKHPTLSRSGSRRVLKIIESLGILERGWLPIESAPKDGSDILICLSDRGFNGIEPREDVVGEAYWFEGDWWWANTSPDNYHQDSISETSFGTISHWMPLPSPPCAIPVQK